MNSNAFDGIRQWVFVALTVAAVACGLARACGLTTVDREVLLFLTMAGVFLVLERIRKLSITRDGISYEVVEQIREGLEAVQKEVQVATETARENQRAMTAGIGGKRRAPEPTGRLIRESYRETDPGVQDPEDVQKGRFGGKAVANGRRLSATVEPAKGDPNNFSVHLRVESLDPARPLAGEVAFHLHQSFLTPVRVIPVVGGAAQLDLLAYGAFTVGAIADDGATALELDLSQDPSFPETFRRN